MGSCRRIFHLGCVLLCFAEVGMAQKPSPPLPGRATIPLARIPRVSKAPKLEDFLESRTREAELVVDDFRQYVPGDGNAATEKTAAYLSYDDKNLYVVFVCHDGGQVRAHLSTSIYGTSALYKWLTLTGRFTSGIGENYFPAGTLDPFLGTVTRATLGFTVRPSARFRVDETGLYYRLGTRAASAPA